MLTDRAIINLKPKEKPYKKSDSGGLHLFVSTSGGKLWRMKYRFNGKEKLLSIGSYPTVTLARARLRREEAKVLLSEGIDPSEHKKTVQKCPEGESLNSFERVAREWHLRQQSSWSVDHGKKILTRLENNIFPFIGKKAIDKISPKDVNECINIMIDRNVIDTAHRALRNCSKIFRYAIATDRADRDVADYVKDALPPVNTKHHPSIVEPKKVGELLRAIEGYQGRFIVCSALKLIPYLMVRSGELRHAEWNEIDFFKAEWRIPKERMKVKEQHIVPLSTQAMELLLLVKKFSGTGKYIFPGVRSDKRPISENTINAALRRLGYDKTEMTGHGFRSMASTLLNEHGWNYDAIEKQLAHAERNKVRAAYNFAKYLPMRKIMMQVWADYLDKLKDGEVVAPVKLLTNEQKEILQGCSFKIFG